MATITDTHKVITLLERKGFSKDQAESLVEAMKEIDQSELAEKSSILALERSVEILNTKLNITLMLLVAIAAGVLFGAQ